MSEQSPTPVSSVGQLSPDGHYQWDGSKWQPTAGEQSPTPPSYVGELSPDGHYRWDGTQWIAYSAGEQSPTPSVSIDHLSPDGKDIGTKLPAPPNRNKQLIIGFGGLVLVGLMLAIVFPQTPPTAPVNLCEGCPTQLSAADQAASDKAAAAKVAADAKAAAHKAAADAKTAADKAAADAKAVADRAAAADKAAGCSPRPCAIDSDMTLYVDKVEKSVPPGSHTLDAGQHVARLTVRWAYKGTDTQAANPLGLDLIGPDHITGNRIDVEQFLIPGCDSGKAPEMAAGAVYGPVTVCFDVGGDPAGSLVLVYKEWIFSGGKKIALP